MAVLLRMLNIKKMKTEDNWQSSLLLLMLLLFQGCVTKDDDNDGENLFFLITLSGHGWFAEDSKEVYKNLLCSCRACVLAH